MLRQKNEQSRYYGDFRGVDFSTDHTLVSERRFPYLVNMYKDYAAGAGQGIETIPGFRRRFVAPNGGRVHGIHSYKDKGGKRRVYVHAGKSLYRWDAYPNDAGVAGNVSATVSEYDEYSASADESVRINTDYIKIEVASTTSAKFIDVRAIRKVGTQKWISIYTEAVYYGETTDALRIPGAYTFTQRTDGDGNATGVLLKVAKVIKDGAGTVVASFEAGDTVEVQTYGIIDYNSHSNIKMDINGGYRETGKTTADGSPIIYYEYAKGSMSFVYFTPVKYSVNNGEDCTFIAPSDVPQAIYEDSNIGGATLIDYIVASDGSRFAPISLGVAADTFCRVYFIRDNEQRYYYQPTADGSKIIKSQSTNEFLKVSCVYRDYGTSKAYTALEYDEYVEDGMGDYLEIKGVDPSYAIVEMRRASSGELITEGDGAGQYKRIGNTILLRKGGNVITGETVALKVRIDDPTVIYDDMNERESTSFVFKESLYILDGKNYLYIDDTGVHRVADDAYVPTTYINIVVGGENADAGAELEPRNMLSPYFKNTFIPDGETTEYYLNENKLEGIEEVKVFDEVVTNYSVDLVNGKITFETAPPKEKEGYPELYAGVEITGIKGIYPAIEGDGETTGAEFRSMIESATICTVFDNRVFFSGIPSKPNFIFWTSLKNPSYIGILNYQQDGVGTTPITAMVPVAKTLLVLKGDTEDGGAAFYHTPLESGIDVMAKSYPSEEGLAGIGCLGAACNFLDDPVYVSRLGLEAVGYLSLQNERSREHRSSLIDAKLVNLEGLADAKLCEWGGYLVLLVDGKIFLADSRQKFADATGAAQYEWYYLEDIGVFEGQYEKYTYLEEFPEVLLDEDGTPRSLKVSYNGKEYPVKLIKDIFPDSDLDIVGEGIDTVIAQVEIAKDVKVEIVAAMYEQNGEYHACLCNGDGEKIGGTFCPAVTVKTMDDGGTENLFFGTTNGVVCSFNFDKRGADGAIPADYYTFDERTILSGCALKMDNCGIPHMTKTTVKKSTVIKVKSFQSTAAKVRVRTNKNPYNEIARINATRFSFDNLDFSDFSFVVGEDSLFAVKEKEKKWVEKQYYIYSDEYKKPFALFYAAFKYFVAGKFKK